MNNRQEKSTVDVLSLCDGCSGAIGVMMNFLLFDMLNTQLFNKLFNIMNNNNIKGSAIWEKYQELNEDIHEFRIYLMELPGIIDT